MSCYEWERGNIKLPAGAMKTVREAVVAAHNAVQERLLTVAGDVLTKVLAANKGKRGVDWHRAIEDATRSHNDDREGFGHWDVASLLLPTRRRPLPATGYAPKWQDVKATRPTKPKRKDVDLLGKRPEHISLGEASIDFDKDGRTVTWTVSENNHACEHAREHPVARAFFAALGRVEWKRGSGGEIVGNDEYHRDDKHEGGGANFVKESFGPNVKKAARGLSFGSRPGNYRWA
jgi:hypothetical protein